MLQADEAHVVSVAQRADATGKGVAVLVAMPRDRFNSDVRRRLQELLLERFGGDTVDYHLSLGDADARTCSSPCTTRTRSCSRSSPEELEPEVRAACRDVGRRSASSASSPSTAPCAAPSSPPTTRNALPRLLQDRHRTPTSPRCTCACSSACARARRSRSALQNEAAHQTHEGAEPLTRLVVAKLGGKMPLSSLLPVLEGLGLTVVEEVPTRLEGTPDDGAYLHDFGVLLDGAQLDLERLSERDRGRRRRDPAGDAESDLLNGLVTRAAVPWRDVQILRAYRRYRQMVRREFTETYQSEVLIEHAETAALIIGLFHARFGRPEVAGRRGRARRRSRDADRRRIDAVPSLDEDRILRGFLQLVLATVRTNAYRPERGRRLSLKLRSADVPSMPAPARSTRSSSSDPEMEGIHLRGGLVARGGIRWSDRREDYRTEVLGLMKAQTVKNAVIVPDGSKGGFVLKRTPSGGDELRDEVRRQYSTLIRGLLDVTDTMVADAVVHPPGVRVHDGDDPYLVVAADKGTAALSDTANAIAARVRVLARGRVRLGRLDRLRPQGPGHHRARRVGERATALPRARSRHRAQAVHRRRDRRHVRRRLRQRDAALGSDPPDRSLRPPQRLPRPDAGYRSLVRRAQAPVRAGAAGSWADYDPSVLSAGGGVFSRNAKSIELTPEVRAALGVTATSLTPAEVCQAILRAPVDLLWNGGIGTFVKAHGRVARRGRRPCERRDPRQRARAPRPRRGRGRQPRRDAGGTRRVRPAGGHINTDAIDNSAGVDCSDHEVNLKILLDLAVERGQLAPETRNPLLAELAEDVCAQVLYDNYLQVQILSQEEAVASERLESHEALMESLESEGALDRALEFLPSGEGVAERVRAGRGLTRPELAVLMGYAKLSLARARAAVDGA